MQLDWDAYVAGEAHSEIRHEFVGGRLYAMAGGTERHDLLAGMIFRQLDELAEREGCRAFGGNRILRIGEVGYYPDLFLVCGPAASPTHEEDAVLVVEILSPSTEEKDRREKVLLYRRLPSLVAYVLVSQRDRRIEAMTRSGDLWRWEAYGPGQVMSAGPLFVVVDDLYDRLDRRATS